MSRSTLVKLLVPATLLVAAIVIAIRAEPQLHRRPGRAAHAALTVSTPAGAAAVGRPAPKPTAQPVRSRPGLDPGAVARAFLDGWLACTYHQRPCTHIAGSLSAYAMALARDDGRSLPTPVELATRPEVTTVQLISACPRSALVIATYLDGHGGTFQLHLNLVREPSGWRVFDVAEAAPHIPLPQPLNRGPAEC
jgi:hypothetical protein